MRSRRPSRPGQVEALAHREAVAYQERLSPGGGLCNGHPVTKRPRKTEDDRSTPLSGVERQRRYRARRTMVSIDVSGTTSALIQDLKGRTGLTTDQLLVDALERLQADRDRPARSVRRRSAATEQTRQPASKMGMSPSPDSPKARAVAMSPSPSASLGDTSAGSDRAAPRRSSQPQSGDQAQLSQDDAQGNLFASPADGRVRRKGAKRPS